MKSLRLGALQWGDKVFDECGAAPRRLPGYESYNKLFSYYKINFWGLECMDKRLRSAIYHILDQHPFYEKQVYTLTKSEIENMFEVAWTKEDLFFPSYSHCVRISTSFIPRVISSTLGSDVYADDMQKVIKTHFYYLYNAMVRKYNKYSVSKILFICEPAQYGNKYAVNSGIPTVVTGYIPDKNNSTVSIIIFSSLRPISSERSMYNKYTFEGIDRNRLRRYL